MLRLMEKYLLLGGRKSRTAPVALSSFDPPASRPSSLAAESDRARQRAAGAERWFFPLSGLARAEDRYSVVPLFNFSLFGYVRYSIVLIFSCAGIQFSYRRTAAADAVIQLYKPESLHNGSRYSIVDFRRFSAALRAIELSL
jgi:hypothetical protein